MTDQGASVAPAVGSPASALNPDYQAWIRALGEHRKNPTGNAIYAAMVSIAKDAAAAGLGKGDTNKHQGYKYRGIDAVCDTLAPLMAKHGVFVTVECFEREEQVRETKSGSANYWVTMRVALTFHATDGSSVSSGPFYGEAADTGDKATGKAESYAYRNGLIKTFCLPVNGADADTEASDPEPTKAPQRGAQAKQTTPEQSPKPGPVTEAQKAEFLALSENYPKGQHRDGLEAISALSLSKYKRRVQQLNENEAEALLRDIRGTK